MLDAFRLPHCEKRIREGSAEGLRVAKRARRQPCAQALAQDAKASDIACRRHRAA
jgi:hypothetical protein